MGKKAITIWHYEDVAHKLIRYDPDTQYDAFFYYYFYICCITDACIKIIRINNSTCCPVIVPMSHA